MDYLQQLMQQQRAQIAFREAECSQDRETLIHLLGEAYALPITQHTLKIVVSRDFPDGNNESRACWRLLREAVESEGGNMDYLLEHLISPKGCKLLARVLVDNTLSGRTAELLAARPEVLVRMPRTSVSLDSDAAIEAVLTVGLGDRLTPYGISLHRVLKYAHAFDDYIRRNPQAILMHFRAIAQPDELDAIVALECRFA